MFKRYLAAAAALALMAASPALADYVVKDGAGASQTFGSFSLSGIQFPKHVMVDPTTGAAIGVSGAPLFVQVTNFPATQAVSAAALPLPTGAGTAALQNTIIANQNATAAGTSATAGQGVQGVAGGVPLATTIRSAGTNRSASLTTTAANLMAANTNRQGWKIKNDCTVAVWINFDATATAAAGSGNFQVAAGGYFASEPGFIETGAMSAIAASGTCNLTAREF